MFKNTFLSNFWPSEVEYNGIKFPTVEHAYQAAKTTNKSLQRYISTLPTPGKAKRVGKVDRPDWSEVKVEVMRNLLKQKFSNPELRLLLERHGSPLIEFNYWHDNFWGDCVCLKCKPLKGENWLGRLLSEIRG